MNYYEHHIRDYDTATAHLTWEEDLAYTRLIRWYYRKEKPIPADVKEACRQVRAISKTQRDAVASVLQEFFELQEDGWHNETCDGVISAFQIGEPEREAKKKNEETRLARHRKERSELFAIINAAGHHLSWNAPIADVRALAERCRTTPETPPATQPETAPATPATATQTPIPITQYPEGVHLKSEEVDGTGVERVPETRDEPSPMAKVCLGLKALGYADTNPHDAKLSTLIGAGLTAEEIVAVGREFQGKGKGFRYVLGTAEGRRRDAANTPPLPNKPVSSGLSKPGQKTAEAAARWLESQGVQP